MTHTNKPSNHHKKHSGSVRSIVPAAFAAALLLLIVFIVLAIYNNRITDYYNAARCENMLESELSDTHLSGFATGLCVEDSDTEKDEAFNAGAAVIAGSGDNSLLFSKNAFERMNPASTTKILTALLAIKHGNLSDMVTVTEDSIITEPGASLAHINPGDRLSLEQLLYALMLPSGNDAANAIAVHIAGSLEAFYDMMNAEAARIGATGSHFANANGITHEDHYSTAYDLYLIMKEALKYDAFRTITSTASYIADYTKADGTIGSSSWKNSNKYIQGTYDAPEGVRVFSGKTGTTLAAASCLVLAEKTGDKEYIEVILKAPNRDTLYEDMNILMNKTVQAELK